MSAFIGSSASLTARTAGSARTAAVSSASSPFLARPAAKAAVAARRAPVPAAKRYVTMSATGESVEDWLSNKEPKLASTVIAIFDACKEISYQIRTASCDKMSCFNDFGDEQLAIDLLADKCIFSSLTESGVVATASSEEVPVEKEITPGGAYSVAFDPLDGSSIIDTNFSVGTIFGVWPGSKLTNVTGREIVASGMAIYGPRTTISLAVDGADGAHEFLLVEDSDGGEAKWVHTAAFDTVNEGKLFAPGNLRAAQDNPGYQELLDYYFAEKYQLRYTGGMVPDVNQILVKGKGVFCNPVSPSAKAKLRMLYEVAPIGYLMEKGGAKSSDGEKSVLDIKIDTTEARSQVCYGSAGEVARFEEMVGMKVAATL